MKQMNKKGLIICIAAAIMLLTFVVCCTLYSNRIKGITGNEWNIKVFDKVNNSKSCIENFDKTITLYLSDVLTDEAFFNELSLLHKQWKIVKADYNNFLSDNPITPKSDTVASANGYTALNNYYKEIDLLFDELLNNTISKDTVSYIYLAHQQKIINYYASYYLSYNIIIGTFDDVSEYSTTGILDY